MADILRREAVVISRYLISQDPSELTFRLYEEAHEALTFEFGSREQKVWELGLSSSFLLGCIDGASRFLFPGGGINRKIFAMFTILESCPEFSQYFLPKPRSYLYLIELFFTGIFGVLKIFIGIAIISGYSWLKR